MTNDELLAGFLDGSLNSEQLQEFEARKAADASFANEAHDMTTVEGLLTNSDPGYTAPVGFLSGVEASVLAKIALVSAGAAGIGYSLGNLWAWVIGAGTVIVGGGAVYLTLNSTPKNTEAEVPTHKQVISAPAETPQIQSPTTESTQQHNTVQNQTPVQSRPQPAAIHEQSQAQDKSAFAEANSPNSTLASLENDYNHCVDQGQSIKCAQIALQIGSVYQQRENFVKATEFYNAALSQAKQTRIVQYQVKALGALGLIAIRTGNTADARRQLNAAIELAKSNGIDADEYVEAMRALH